MFKKNVHIIEIKCNFFRIEILLKIWNDYLFEVNYELRSKKKRKKE